MNFTSLKFRTARYRWTGGRFTGPGVVRTTSLTWCRAVRPSTFAVSISAPFWSSRRTSSLSPAAHAAKNTQPDENFILRVFDLGETGSRFVSDCAQRFNCSALLKRAELERVSMDMLFNSSYHNSLTTHTPLHRHTAQLTDRLGRWLDLSNNKRYYSTRQIQMPNSFSQKLYPNKENITRLTIQF